jgi:hypothetical protein
MEQMTEFLKGMAKMKADIRVNQTKMDTNREEMRAIMKVHHKMMATFRADQGKAKAYIQKRWRQIQKKQNPRQSIRNSPRKTLQWKLAKHRISGRGTGI